MCSVSDAFSDWWQRYLLSLSLWWCDLRNGVSIGSISLSGKSTVFRCCRFRKSYPGCISIHADSSPQTLLSQSKSWMHRVQYALELWRASCAQSEYARSRECCQAGGTTWVACDGCLLLPSRIGQLKDKAFLIERFSWMQTCIYHSFLEVNISVSAGPCPIKRVV